MFLVFVGIPYPSFPRAGFSFFFPTFAEIVPALRAKWRGKTKDFRFRPPITTDT